MEYPISIIIPASKEYQKKYKDSCLSSIPDGCEIILLDWDLNNTRIDVLLNEGISRAKNEFILPLGIDDKLYEGIIPILMENLDDSDVYFSPLKMFDGGDSLLVPNKNPTLEDFKINNQVYFTSLIRKSKALEIGGYYRTEDDYYYEDWDFWIRMKKAGAKFKYIDTPIFYYRIHPNQISNSMLKDGEELRKKILKHCFPEDYND